MTGYNTFYIIWVSLFYWFEIVGLKAIQERILRGNLNQNNVYIKGALDNFNIIPTFFSKKKNEISISSEAYACKMTTC